MQTEPPFTPQLPASPQLVGEYPLRPTGNGESLTMNSQRRLSVFQKQKLDNMHIFLIETSKTQVEHDPNSSPSGQHFFSLKSYFTLGWYTGLIPFKPVYSLDQQGIPLWTMKTSIFQKILISLLLIWFPYWFYNLTNIPKILKGFTSNPKPTASAYFLVLRQIVNYTKITVFSWIIFRRSCEVIHHFNLIYKSPVQFPMDQSSHSTKVHKTEQLLKWFLMPTYISFLVFSVLGYLFLHYPGANYILPPDLFKVLIHDARQRYFMSRNSLQPTLEGYSSGEIFLGCVETWLRFSNYWCFMGMEAFFIVVLPTTYWAATRNFEDYSYSLMSQCRSQTDLRLSEREVKALEKAVQKLYDAYSEVKVFSSALNGTWSRLFFIWLIDYSMRMIFLFNRAIGSQNFVNVAAAMLQLGYWAMCMLFSSDAFRRMKCLQLRLQEWLNGLILSNNEDGRVSKLIGVLIQELENEPAGLGTEGVYKMDYGFTAQLLLVACTLFIVSFEEH